MRSSTWEWFVLALAVLLLAGLLFGVAAVSVGHGSPLSETTPDRRGPVLPADRVAAPDIEAVRFSMALRGYRMDEVDDVLDRLSTEISVRDAEISRLRSGAGGGPEASYDESAAAPAVVHDQLGYGAHGGGVAEQPVGEAHPASGVGGAADPLGGPDPLHG
jgi:DivIVA domain-containing protein